MERKQLILRITSIPRTFNNLLLPQLEYCSKEYDFLLATSNGPEFNKLKNRISFDVIEIPIKRKISVLSDLKAIFSLYKLIKRHKPDIVHTQTPKAGLIGMVASFLAGTKHRVHSVGGLKFQSLSGFRFYFLKQVETLIYKLSTAVIPNSETLKKYILKEISDNKKVKVLGSGATVGVDTTVFQNTPELANEALDIRKALHIKEDEFVFLFIGRLVKDKGIDELVGAFDKLNWTFPNIKLLLLGFYEPDLDPIGSETVRIISSNKNIIQLGYMKNVRPYLSLSDAFVFPSYREGLSNALMEAAAMECVILCSDITGNIDIISDNVHGLLFPSQSQEGLYKRMFEVVNSDVDTALLSANARTRIMSVFSREYVLSNLLDFYRSLK